MKISFKVEYSQEKNILLKQTRGISFDEVKQAIEKGKTLDNIAHFNQKKYAHQRIFLVVINEYVYAVPYVFNKERNVVFLKTIYPNRVLTKKYLKEKNYEKNKK